MFNVMDSKYGPESDINAGDKTNDLLEAKSTVNSNLNSNHLISSVGTFANTSPNLNHILSENTAESVDLANVSSNVEPEPEEVVKNKRVKSNSASALGLNNTMTNASSNDPPMVGRRPAGGHKANAGSTSTKRRNIQIRSENEDESSMNSLISASNSQDGNNCLKVPPLRIVISSSTPRANGKEYANSANSEVIGNNHASSSGVTTLTSGRNYVVSSTSNFDESNDNARSNNCFVGNNHHNSNASMSDSINMNSNNNHGNNNGNGSLHGRVTRSQRAAAQHLTSGTDDSNSRGSPAEVDSNENHTEFGMRSEKESNKENKEQQRKRKGRQRAATAANNGNNSSNNNNSPTVNNNNNGVSSSNNNNSLSCNINESGNIDDDTDSMSSSNSAPGNASNPSGTSQHVSNAFALPTYNCLHMYQTIRRQVDKRRQNLCEHSVSPKAPQDFQTYLLATGKYNLHGSSELLKQTDDVPEVDGTSACNLVQEEQLKQLLSVQAQERQQMRVQHQVEKEKIRLAAEQEILRVHGRAALALANRSQPLSFATILRDEEIYNAFDTDIDDKCMELLSVGHNGGAGSHNGSSSSNISGRDHANHHTSTSRNEYSRATYSCTGNGALADLFALTGNSEDIGARCRFSGRLLHSWLQDVQHKWNKIRKDTLYRQRREAESLHASQKLQWQWTVGELSRAVVRRSDPNWANTMQNDRLIPMVEVSEEFESNT